MEGNTTKLLKEGFHDGNNFVGEHFLGESSKQNDSEEKKQVKSVRELSEEEETLKIHLDKLKKENFTLEASIKAWQTTLQNKLDEFKEADLKLEETYNEIWSEREKFCSDADKFNDAYGILSDWWTTQLKFVTDLENLEKKSSEHQKCNTEIEKLEREVELLKKEIDGLRARQQQVAVAEVHATADGKSTPVRGGKSTGEVSSGPKKIRYSEAVERIEYCRDGEPTKNVLYSIVDLEKLRKVNRNRKRFRKNNLLGKVKKFLKM